ncbi:MAG: Z1 domain-containing protein [Spirochaetia bacterium]|jgi:hypothetical protein|nr:Z1 domain-containing protein [Spirochaetia bacterium]MCI2096154.1 Z1 domain-containing protein [Lactococcus lactis]
MTENETKICQSIEILYQKELANDPSIGDIQKWIDYFNAFFTPTDNRSNVTSELIKVAGIWSRKEMIFKDNTDHVDWEIPSNLALWERYKKYLGRSLRPTDITSIDKSTSEILSLLENPSRPDCWNRRGLVVGNVQSGKTANYIGLICKAADVGYRVIIVLAGLTNSLREQTQIRLEEGFLGYSTDGFDTDDTIKVIGVGKENPVDRDHTPQYVTIRGDHGDFNRKIAKNMGIASHQPLLLVVKKNVSVLGSLLKWLKRNYITDCEKDTNRPVCSDSPLLMIDDESDSASVDTGEGAIDEEGEPNSEYNPKRINSLIRQLLYFFTKSAYVGYTATPFANIFIHEKGTTKKEGPDLFPQSFIVPLEHNDVYFGPEKLLGTHNERTGERNNSLIAPIVRNINDTYTLNVPRGSLEYQKKDWLPLGHKSDWVPNKQNTVSGLPKSLEDAILSFYLVCTQRYLRGQGNKHCSMLIHVSRYQKVQKEILTVVSNFDNYCKIRLINNDGDGLIELLNRLQTIWEEDFVKNWIQYNQELGAETSSIASWKQIQQNLPLVMGNIANPKLLNGNSSDVLDYEKEKDRGLKVIALGGDKFSRGLTLEGLTISYFIRTSNTFDTLMQMGRWFGYRPQYLDLCRIYTTNDLIDSYCKITDATQELQEEFAILFDATGKGTPKEYGLKVRNYSKLRATSTAKAKHTYNLEVDFEGKMIQTILFSSDKEKQNHNWEITKQFIQTLPNNPEINPCRDFRKWNAALWRNIPLEKVATFLKNYQLHPNSVAINPLAILKFLKDSEKSGFTNLWNIAIIGVADQTRKETNLFPGIKFSRRTLDNPKEDTLSIKVLTNSWDEFIDFNKKEYDEAKAYTKKIDQQIQKERKPGSISGAAARYIRTQNDNEDINKCLLLIYPFIPMDGNNEPQLVGFAIVMPNYRTPNKYKHTYSVNHIFYEQYIHSLTETNESEENTINE